MALRAVLTNAHPSIRPEINQVVEGELINRFRTLLVSGPAASANAVGLSYAVANGSFTPSKPAMELEEPENEAAGWYNSMVILLFAPDVPLQAVKACETCVKKLLGIRKKTKDGTLRLYHVICLPSNHQAEQLFEATAATPIVTNFPKVWQDGNNRLCSLPDHPQIVKLLRWLVVQELRTAPQQIDRQIAPDASTRPPSRALVRSVSTKLTKSMSNLFRVGTR